MILLGFPVEIPLASFGPTTDDANGVNAAYKKYAFKILFASLCRLLPHVQDF